MIKTGWVLLLIAAGLHYVYRVGIGTRDRHVYAAEKGGVTSVFDNVSYIGNHDGDTFYVNLTGLPPVFGDRIPVRISHVDAPEVDGKRRCEKRAAELAKTKLSTLLSNAKIISLRNVKRDKYFRLNAEVLVDGIDVSSWLLSHRLAYKYEGKTRPLVNWCTYSP